VRPRNLALTVVVTAAVAATATISADALRNRQATIVIPAGEAVTFAGTGWRCVNHHGYLTCQHETDRPYIDLNSRRGGNFTVTIHPVAGQVGLPQKTKQQGDPIPVYTFSSTLK
jgi:hypothetical protein